MLVETRKRDNFCGCNSIVWREGEWIFKRVKKGRKEIREEYEFLHKELGKDWVLETVFFENRGDLMLKQRYVDGEKPIDYVQKNGLGSYGEILERIDFVFRKKGVMADVFGRPHVWGWYDPIRTPNVIIGRDGAVLVDVGLARLSKLSVVGNWHNRKLSLAVRDILARG